MEWKELLEMIAKRSCRFRPELIALWSGFNDTNRVLWSSQKKHDRKEVEIGSGSRKKVFTTA